MTGNYEGLHLADLFVQCYTAMSTEWRYLILDEDCDLQAPAQQWRAAELPDALARLIQAGELTAMTAAGAARSHLGLLARAYWPNPYDPNTPESARYPGHAIYPLARGVVEALSFVSKLHNSASFSDGRPAAEVLMWAAAKQWRSTIEAAGFEIQLDAKTNAPFVAGGDRAQPVSISRQVKAAFGRDGQRLYGMWSAMSHHNPVRLGQYMSIEFEDRGARLSSAYREDLHAETVIGLAKIVTQSAIAHAKYFGRSASSVVATCSEIVAILDRELPAIKAAVEERE